MTDGAETIERSVTHATFAVERKYDASPARVFAAWAEPERKARWFGNPEDGVAEFELDFRVGGREFNRGKVEGQERRGNALAVQAKVPLGEMFGYATDLRSSTQGRATFTMQFERYEEVAQSVAEQITEGGPAEPVAAVS